MTLAGPRPERPSIAAEYEETMPEFRLRLQVKAGLTGYAQVYGKYNTTPSYPSRLPDSRKERIKEFELLTGTQIERVYLSKYRKRYLKGLVKSLIPYKLKVIIRGGGKQ